MDLIAYSKISDLESLASLNGIHVPRLRGYRLMSEEAPISAEEISQIEKNILRWTYKSGCCSIPRFCLDAGCSEFSPKTDRIRAKYLDENGDLRWELLHGKHRKNMKFAAKKKKMAVRKQYEVFNKYAGMEDVLYIHARIGGENWNYYRGYLLEKEEWFLERVDDSFDSSYCDIYAKINKAVFDEAKR